jgi:hypothetical protein
VAEAMEISGEMMTPNEGSTYSKGRSFAVEAATVLSKHFGVEFRIDHPIAIGDPPKKHKFDLVSEDALYVEECKNYSWTKAGNSPSAKLGHVNEAVFCLSRLPDKVNRFVVMRRDTHPKRKETLAEYYFRTYRHLLGDICVLELDAESREVKDLSKSR